MSSIDAVFLEDGFVQLLRFHAGFHGFDPSLRFFGPVGAGLKHDHLFVFRDECGSIFSRDLLLRFRSPFVGLLLGGIATAADHQREAE